MTSVAVLAHTGKSLGGGLSELRDVLAREGVDAPLWYEVPKSKKAPKKVKQAVADGADLLFVWGGDGMVQRCIPNRLTTIALQIFTEYLKPGSSFIYGRKRSYA